MPRFVRETAPNPFEFGRELAPTELVDRDDELAMLARVAVNRGKCFFIGPRRFGKTSILATLERRLERRGIAVIRCDAEAYETLGRLAEALLAAAARTLSGPAATVGARLKKVFARVRPEITYDVSTHRFTISLAGAERAPDAALPLLTEVLDGIERLAAERRHPVLVVLDEFQQVIKDGGESAERQIRAAIQRHRHVGYIFAGSQTRLLAEITGDPARPFWKLGERRFLGPIPRADFRPFLARGFTRFGFRITPEGIERLLDAAEDVPYNVQRLASACWERLRTRQDRSLSANAVDAALQDVVRNDNPAYTRLWTSLTQAQKKALKAVIDERGRELLARAVVDRYGVATSTMQRALQALDTLGIVRQDEADDGGRYRLEDPFLAAWLAMAQEDA